MNILGKISEIYIYPIKSLPGIRLDTAIITKYGIAHPENPLVYDRKWMIVDEKGNFRTQRQLPRMALIKLTIEGDSIVLSAPNKVSIRVPIVPVKYKMKCRVWKDHIEGYAYDEEISEWLSEFLEVDNLDLVCFGDDLEPRKVESSDIVRHDNYVMYADYSPFMLVSEASLKDLNSKLEKSVSMRNFRPNFVVTGCNAFDEDNWDTFSIEGSRFTKIKHCTRCLLTTVHPDKGIKDPTQQPFKMLKESDKELYGMSPKFGIHIITDNKENGLIVACGDKIIKET